MESYAALECECVFRFRSVLTVKAADSLLVTASLGYQGTIFADADVFHLSSIESLAAENNGEE